MSEFIISEIWKAQYPQNNDVWRDTGQDLSLRDDTKTIFVYYMNYCPRPGAMKGIASSFLGELSIVGQLGLIKLILAIQKTIVDFLEYQGARLPPLFRSWIAK